MIFDFFFNTNSRLFIFFFLGGGGGKNAKGISINVGLKQKLQRVASAKII
jgi:hypothetical protein